MSNPFDPEKSLFSLPVVRWCFGVPFAGAVGATISISYYAGKFPIELTAMGWENFAELYKVPATFIAVGLSLVGLCAANHRSEQTKRQIERTSKQIKLTEEQNSFTNYFKHAQEFKDYCEELAPNFKHLSGKRKFHKKYFPNAIEGNFHIKREIIQDFDDYLIKFKDNINRYTSANSYQTKRINYDLFMAQESIAEKMAVEFFMLDVHIDGKNEVSHTGLRNFIFNIINNIKFLDQLLQFDVAYTSSSLFIKISNLNITSFPDEPNQDYKADQITLSWGP